LKEKDKKETENSEGKDPKIKHKPQAKRKKKTEQYKNQVIIDQYGVFEYDKDPEGYKKARKRQQNRESALRARDKRAHKMDSVETRLEKMEMKSSNLEKENMVLKAEKLQLQDQVKNLLSIITSFGANKRFKTGEEEEIGDQNTPAAFEPLEVEDDNKEALDYKIKEIEEVSSPLSPKPSSPEKHMLKLMRNNNDSIFDQEEGGIGDIFQKGMMLSLTVVM